MRHLVDLAARLRLAEGPDRRLDSEVTAFLLAPPQAQLDDLIGIDGWDIMLPAVSGHGPPEVWLAADEVLYVTQFVDAAIELCEQRLPDTSGDVILKALSRVMKSGVTEADAAVLAGNLARFIVAELVDAVSATRTSRSERRA